MSDGEEVRDPTGAPDAPGSPLAPASPARGSAGHPDPAEVVPFPNDGGKSRPAKPPPLALEEEEDDSFFDEVWRWCCCRRVHSGKHSSVGEAVLG